MSITKGIRVNQLAKELGLESKSILNKCREEGLGEKVPNHMSLLSVGLADTVREWFSDGGGVSTVKTAAPPRTAAKANSRTTVSKSFEDVGAPLAAVTKPTPQQSLAPRISDSPEPTSIEALRELRRAELARLGHAERKPPSPELQITWLWKQINDGYYADVVAKAWSWMEKLLKKTYPEVSRRIKRDRPTNFQELLVDHTVKNAKLAQEIHRIRRCAGNLKHEEDEFGEGILKSDAEWAVSVFQTLTREIRP